MAVSDDGVLSAMRRSAKAAPVEAPNAEAPVPESAAETELPMASPMSTPEPKMGNKEGALVNLGMALDLIEQSLPALGSETDEGQAAMAALKSLTKLLGTRKRSANELQDAEILQLLQNLPRAGGMSPEARALATAPVIPGVAGPGTPPISGAPMPGAAPAPMPGASTMPM